MQINLTSTSLIITSNCYDHYFVLDTYAFLIQEFYQCSIEIIANKWKLTITYFEL